MRRKDFWEIWLNNKEKRNSDFKEYLLSGKIKKETEVKELIEGHLKKADHNLRFAKSTINLKEFNDWAIVTAYYAIYHASLALCALKGYATKDHNATLLILIKEFYRNGLEKEEIDIIGNISIEKEEVLYYIEARTKRKKASYSIGVNFEKSEVELLRLKAISFVNKVKEITEPYT